MKNICLVELNAKEIPAISGGVGVGIGIVIGHIISKPKPKPKPNDGK